MICVCTFLLGPATRCQASVVAAHGARPAARYATRCTARSTTRVWRSAPEVRDAAGSPTCASQPARRLYFAARAVFSSTRYSTIRRIRSMGMGRSRGNWTEPLPRLNDLSSSSNACIPLGIG